MRGRKSTKSSIARFVSGVSVCVCVCVRVRTIANKGARDFSVDFSFFSTGAKKDVLRNSENSHT